MDTTFDRETAVTRLDPGRYSATMATSWWVVRGPNGGYLAAIILRALTDAVDDAERTPRSLTVHYTSAPTEGDVELHTVVERTGRSLTTCTCRMEQGGKLVALAVAAFSKPRDGPEFCDVVMPQVPGPEFYVPMRRPPPEAPPIATRYDTRWAIGHPPVPGVPSGARAVAGGWIRLPEARVVDPILAAAITDGWLPPTFSRIQQAVVVPTVDLTIHFRAALPHPGLAPDAFVLAVFRTNVAADGFLEEDGEIWAPDGTLLAQSRQLATILPLV
ncbi:MAG TPA: thioesterase family protein [Acidimicrobiia bacterium]